MSTIRRPSSGDRRAPCGYWKRLAENQLQIGDDEAAVIVSVTAEGREFELRAEEIDEPIRYSKKPTRLGFRFTKPVQELQVVFTIDPKK